MKKIIIIITKIILVLVLLFMTVSIINHKIKLKSETKKFTPPGKIVEVNKHKMHIYSEGSGAETLVFMSGGGTCSPYLDFKSLYTEMSKDYKIAVVEKAGYGFSEVYKIPRDIDTILEETRKALELSGEKVPYILVPHSMSGIEAIYWAQKYPKEVKAIIGIDAAIPEAYNDFPLPSKSILNLSSFAARIGVTRFIPSICDSSAAIQAGSLSEYDKEMYRAMFYRSTQTSNMLEEVKQIKSNAKKVGANEIPIDTPMYFFISNGKEIPVQNWDKLLIDYADKLKNGKYMSLDASHYLHDYEPKLISKEIKEFIKSIEEHK